MSFIDQYTSRTVRAKLEIGKVVVPVSGFTLRHTIDELPHAEISLQLENQDSQNTGLKGSVKMDVAAFRKMAVLLQEKVLNEFRVTPDVRFTVWDGDESDSTFKLVFNGFLGKPEVIIQEGMVVIKVGMIHAKAALQAWNGQIYNYIEPYVLPHFHAAFDASASVEAQAAKGSSSVSIKVLALAEYMMRSVGMTPNQTDTDQFDMLPIHLLNQKAFGIVETVLKASETMTEIEGLDHDNFDSANLYEVLFEMLRNSPNFWTVLQQLGQMFLFQTNADWAGNLWLEPIQSIADGPGDRVIQVPLAQIRFNVAHLFELPIQQVVVVGGGSELYGFGVMGLNQGTVLTPVPVSAGEFYAGRVPADGEVWSQMQFLARWPETTDRKAVGNFYVLQAPFWINSDTILDTMTEQLQKGLDVTSLRWDQIIDAQINLQNAFLKSGKPRKKLLSYMAKQLFNSLYLGSTYASLTVPFDLRPCVGRRYRIKDLTGEAIFDGFLKEVVHSMSLAADGASSATTDLVFTHVIATGAMLKQLTGPDFPGSTTLPIDRVDPTFRTPDSVPATTLAEQLQTARV